MEKWSNMLSLMETLTHQASHGKTLLTQVLLVMMVSLMLTHIPFNTQNSTTFSHLEMQSRLISQDPKLPPKLNAQLWKTMFLDLWMEKNVMVCTMDTLTGHYSWVTVTLLPSPTCTTMRLTLTTTGNQDTELLEIDTITGKLTQTRNKEVDSKTWTKTMDHHTNISPKPLMSSSITPTSKKKELMLIHWEDFQSILKQLEKWIENLFKLKRWN